MRGFTTLADCGVGTGAYRFVWAMGGDNQNFSDMDPAPIATLK